ncbi:MAG: D-alanyl-D-alanine carboxypeptidase/D-alanyl-D-alanine-endopeptidase [Phycisphaerae bacterium]|nr:D-alanyl-D-alanine carboxypeptidase/D-alanyl-D-alanine-endopeptidase [Phycisphaerae bacterium]MDD5381364.1 D-alanyl-D-alanine carboxypeptidase/D-alanyl-D-alanine-endopeptidase [Phycisphaerae bacterium]
MIKIYPVMNIKKKFLASALLSIGLVSIASAGLAEKIDGIIHQSSQKGVQYSIIVVKADSGKVVYSHDADKALIPASNMKIITSAAALKYLGPDYKFKTEVGLCGDSLVVKGSGDPLLGDEATDAKYQREPGWIFKDIAASLKQNDKTAIKDIIVDSSIFDNERVHPHWPREQLNQWYACEVSGLNYNDNCIAMTVTNTDGNVIISLRPETGFIKITNEVKPITKDKKVKSAVGAYRNRTPNILTIKGKCQKQEGPVDVAIEKPAEFFGFLLRENMAGAGINVDGQILEGPAPGDCDYKKIAEYNTPITDCLARCNKNSLGLAAEAFLKTIAAKTEPNGKNGSWAKGRELISSYLLALGIDKEEFNIDDGSGLSRENKLSANAIAKVLLDVYKSKNWELYKDSLAEGGVEGTIRKPFKEEKYKSKVFGKTGYINGVKSLSGICSSREGEYIFSILANKVKGGTRDALNDIAKAIIDND